MAVIDMVKWNGNPSILAWKFPSEELSTWTQLIVNETQEAYLVKEGVYQGPFGAGRHTLSTENIPLLRGLIGLPFGKRSPFTAEVWYVNLATNLDIRWGTPDPIQLKDPKYHIMMPVRAFGQYGIKISDPKKFLLKLVGTLNWFDVDTLTEYFKGVFTTKIKTGIAKAILKNECSILEISTELETLSNMLLETLAPDMSEYGIKLTQFNIHSINVPENDKAVASLKATLAKKTEMSILGFDYQQERSFDVMETAAGNEGTSGNVMGGGMGLGMGLGVGQSMGNSFSQISPNLQPVNSKLNIKCLKCDAINNVDAKFCNSCGEPIAKETHKSNCSSCKALIPDGAKFCPSCGCKLSKACSKCGSSLKSEAKFCFNCGEPQ